MIDSYEIIAEAVRDFWHKNHYAEDVIVFFEQKYEHDQLYDVEEELVLCHGDSDLNTVSFNMDFCEGQTWVRNIKIVPLSDVTHFYYMLELGGMSR